MLGRVAEWVICVCSVCLPGICRGIDMEKRLYHILTPVAPEQLRNVNCLLVGAISIPHCVLKSQVSVAPRDSWPWAQWSVRT